MRRWSKLVLTGMGLTIVGFIISGKNDRDRCTGSDNCSYDGGGFFSPRVYAQEAYDALKKNFIPDGNGQSQSGTRKNLIDEFIFSKMEKDGITPAAPCKDEEFIRRVMLDMTGRIPTPDEVRNFLQDEDPNKRDNLVDSLLGTPEFVDQWTMWFGDLYRNTVYPVTPKGRNNLYQYIRNFVEKNKPYNEVVTELLTATGDNWTKGPVNFLIKAAEAPDFEINEDMFDNLAARTSEVFLGVPLLCISCHDGRNHLEKINLWLLKKKRDEFWRQSAFFTKIDVGFKEVGTDMQYRFNVTDAYQDGYNMEAEGGIRPHRHGTAPKPSYIFTGKNPASKKNLRAELARMMTSDFQFARATVNRLWAHFMVAGIVDPPNAFDLARQDSKHPPPAPWAVQPSHPQLLNALAKEFQDKGYDLQHIMQLICKSSAYQLSSSYDQKKWKPEYASYYARKLVRTLTSEEIHDAIVTATWVTPSYKVNGLPKQVDYAMKLPGPEEPVPEDNSYEAIEFLNAFGRGDRFFNERNRRLSLTQPLALMHSGIVDNAVSASNEGGISAYLINSEFSEEQIVEELYLATLSRYPAAQEKRSAHAALKRDRSEGTEDLLWSLINKMDFIFNH